MSTSVEAATEIRPFHVEFPEEAIADLRRRIAATRWPSKELVGDRSQGVQLATAQALAGYWLDEYDWRKCEAKLNALPQFTTEIDGVDVHFIHVRSEHANALPVIITHGWPGSIVEMLEVIGPLTDPTAHGGSADDAFDVVIPSIPGYGLSAEPTEPGWWAGRVAKDWPELMKRLGYDHYVAQGGDVGAAVTDAMGRMAPEGLVGIHTNLFVPALGGAKFSDETEEEKAANEAMAALQGDRLRLLPGAVDAAADDRLRPARLADRARGLAARPRHGRVLQDRERVRRRQAVGQPHPRSHPRQHHALLADGHRSLGGAVVLGERAGDGEERRAGSASDGAPVRLHHLPRRDLEDASQLGRGGVPERRLLQRGRQGWPLRRLGRAGALQSGATRGIQFTPLKGASHVRNR